MPRALRMLALALLAFLAAGCPALQAPPAPRISRSEAVEEMRQRAEQFHTVVDTDISLVMTTRVEDEQARSPALGGHIAFDRRLPGLWLSAEKLGRQVFSLKALGMEFSLLLPETRELVTGGPRAYRKMPFLVRPDEVQTMFAGPETLGLTWPQTEVSTTDGAYRFDVNVMGVVYRRVLLDAWTGEVKAIERYDVRGRLLTRIELADYVTSGETAFPRRLIVERPLAGVTVTLELGNPKLNKDIPRAAFTPHRRPDFRHVDLDYRPLSDVEAFRGEQ